MSAFSAQLQEHLPPVDTVDATWKTKSGVTGTFSVSFGTSFSGSEYAVACEHGSISVVKGTVTVIRDGKEEKKDFPDEGAGVKQEVKAWAEGILAGKQDPRQSPEEALKDLELVSHSLSTAPPSWHRADL